MIRALCYFSITFIFIFFAVKSFASFNDLGSGTLLLQFEDNPQKQWVAPSLETEVNIEVTGPIVRATLIQTFTNPGKDWAHGTYGFPLPETAAVDRLRMVIGERVIEGEIKEKEEARQIFENAKQSGKKASLVKQQRENLFVTRVANIPPGESIRISIEYQHPVNKQGDIYSLRFPMTITPRYRPGIAIESNTGAASTNQTASENGNLASSSGLQGGKPDDIHPPWARQGVNNNPTNLSITLLPGFKLDNLRSLFHQVEKTPRGDNGFTLLLDKDQHQANRDFVLQWTPELNNVPQVELFSERIEGLTGTEDYHLLMVTPPAPELVASTPAREIIFVLDTSGSMGGESIRQAKRALSWSLDRLGSDDRFNIIEFNSGSWNLFGSSQGASNGNLTRAKAFVDSLNARGGTEMKPALEAALCGFCAHQGRLRQVVFITDGAIGNEDELFKVIKGKLGNSRLFTVGIGAAPNTYFMRKAAETGRGTYTYIGDISKAGEAMAELFLTMESPMLTDVSVKGDSQSPLDISPAPVPDIYAGRSLVLFLKGPLPSKLKIEGNAGTKEWHQIIDTAHSKEGKGIRTLWGRSRVETLMDKYRFSYDQAAKKEIRGLVVDTALKHHLVSAFTSLVAVEKTKARPADKEGRDHLLANNSPYGTRFGLTSTATNSGISLLAGLALLLIALALSVSNGRFGHKRGLLDAI